MKALIYMTDKKKPQISQNKNSNNNKQVQYIQINKISQNKGYTWDRVNTQNNQNWWTSNQVKNNLSEITRMVDKTSIKI